MPLPRWNFEDSVFASLTPPTMTDDLLAIHFLNLGSCFDHFFVASLTSKIIPRPIHINGVHCASHQASINLQLQCHLTHMYSQNIYTEYNNKHTWVDVIISWMLLEGKSNHLSRFPRFPESETCLLLSSWLSSLLINDVRDFSSPLILSKTH